MIAEALSCFSSLVGYLIKKANEEEMQRYEKWIKLWERIIVVAFGILFPIFIPFVALMYLSEKKSYVEAIAFGGSLLVGNWVGLSLLAMYQLIKYRNKGLKENLIYSTVSFVVFLSLYFLGKFSQWMAIGV